MIGKLLIIFILICVPYNPTSPAPIPLDKLNLNVIVDKIISNPSGLNSLNTNETKNDYTFSSLPIPIFYGPHKQSGLQGVSGPQGPPGSPWFSGAQSHNNQWIYGYGLYHPSYGYRRYPPIQFNEDIISGAGVGAQVGAGIVPYLGIGGGVGGGGMRMDEDGIGRRVEGGGGVTKEQAGVVTKLDSINHSQCSEAETTKILNQRSTSTSANPECWQTNQISKKLTEPPSETVHLVANCLHSRSRLEKLLDPLLVVRTPGSQGSSASRAHIMDHLTKLGYDIQLDKFQQNTLIGKKEFVNIIATSNMEAPRRLVLAAHYDSKLTPTGFIGATDSAVPCAMMLDIAASFKSASQIKNPHIALQFIFFDGEEAFKQWTDEDSLYGSRHLAEKWAKTSYKKEKNGCGKQGTDLYGKPSVTEIDRMDAFILLDLIGEKGTQFQHFVGHDTSELFHYTRNIEQIVRGVTDKQEERDQPVFFQNQPSHDPVEDDHKPFLQKGYKKIVHLIANPFPKVWHKISDNKSALDKDSISLITKIIRVFVYSYLYL